MDQRPWEGRWPPSLALGWPLAWVFRLPWPLRGWSHRPLLMLASFFSDIPVSPEVVGRRKGGVEWGGGERTAITAATATLGLCKALDTRDLPLSTRQPHFMAERRDWRGPSHPP